MPKSRLGFWRGKLEGNRERDQRNLAKLRRMNWKCLVVWECQVRGREKLAAKVRAFLEDAR
jgi:DNA mismatch endonuclease (patch repair protein)